MNILHVQRFDLNTAWEALRDGIDWQQRSVTVYGKTYPQPRLTAWYGSATYLYSGLQWDPCPMPYWLADLAERVGKEAGASFNSVLCNLYRDGQDTVGWHADDEPLFGPDPVVASLSYGAARTFQLRHNETRAITAWDLHDGDLFIMRQGVQSTYQHRVPRTPKKMSVGPRINLTFRATV